MIEIIKWWLLHKIQKLFCSRVLVVGIGETIHRYNSNDGKFVIFEVKK